MKILINRKPIEGPWGGGNLFVKAFCDVLGGKGHAIVYELSEDIDVIFMQDPRYSELRISINEIVEYKKRNPNTKIIHRVNECDARKGTSNMDELLRQCSEYTDTTVFVSDWMKQYHVSRGWKCTDTRVIHNGVNREHFKPVSSKMKIDNDKINIVAHHWSNNRMKGFDVYEALDEFVGKNSDFTFTYIGRELGTFRNTKLISPIHGIELGRMLARYDVYVSGSRFDPGPNHILEALACDIPTYVISTGGGAVEFAGQDHSYKSIVDLLDVLENKLYHKNNFKVQSWESCIEKYMGAINDCGT